MARSPLQGVSEGKESLERHYRLSDHSRPEFAEIRVAPVTEVRPGKIALVRTYEIHTENTAGKETVAVIIRSPMSGMFNPGRHVAEKNEYFENLALRQTPVEMLPDAQLKWPVDRWNGVYP